MTAVGASRTLSVQAIIYDFRAVVQGNLVKNSLEIILYLFNNTLLVI